MEKKDIIKSIFLIVIVYIVSVNTKNQTNIFSQYTTFFIYYYLNYHFHHNYNFSSSNNVKYINYNINYSIFILIFTFL